MYGKCAGLQELSDCEPLASISSEELAAPRLSVQAGAGTVVYDVAEALHVYGTLPTGRSRYSINMYRTVDPVRIFLNLSRACSAAPAVLLLPPHPSLQYTLYVRSRLPPDPALCGWRASGRRYLPLAILVRDL